jgi:hypothetical protein
LKTLVYKIKVSDEDKVKLKKIQENYSRDFRRLYNNLDLSQDKEFINSLNTKSSKLKEYLVKEVISFWEKYQSTKNKIKEKLENLELDFKKITELKRSLERGICFGGRKNLQRRTKGLITNEEWKELRLYPVVFYGETSRKGNRFFDFKNLSNGDILFKLEATNIKIPIKISNKKHKRELISLQDLCLSKGISLTVKLTHEKIYLTFDETILSRTNFDYKLHQMNKPKDLNKLETKEYWKSKYKEHEDKLKKDKLERYLSIDVNPNEIGFSIADDKLNIIEKGCYQIIGKVNEKKRKHEYSQIIKELFNKVKHYKISYFVIEDLEINKDDFGNKVSNRKNKLEFKKNYIFSLITRRCNETGTILRKINPCYSSFIGNLLHKEYDPVASSIEILRRGIGQYNKGFKLIPEFDKDSIITDKIDDYVDLSQFSNFVELFKSIRDKSYRRKDISFSSQKFTKSDKSHVCLCF